MQVVIMGLGYIGLPTAALIASKKMHVHGVDVNSRVVDTINQGKIHIVEPDLDGLVHYDVQQGYLVAAAKPREANVFVIAVPTPFKSNHRPDIAFVQRATRMVIPFLRPGNLFILESTSPVGTTDKIAALIFKKRPELKNKIHIAYCPERVLPGSVIHELERNDRVIGGINEKSTDAAVAFYGRFVKGELHRTNARTAEMCKLTENACRDVNIALANELSMICDKAGINVHELIALASKHPRVKILQPGPGVGGHCIAVDPWFIVSDFRNEAKLIRQARLINNYKTEWVIGKIKKAADDLRKDLGRIPVIACMGLAYKPNIDDLRESPALEIYEELKKEKYRVLAVEPNVTGYAGIAVETTAQALDKADLVVFLVAHKEFKKLRLEKDRPVLDFCGVAMN